MLITHYRDILIALSITIGISAQEPNQPPPPRDPTQAVGQLHDLLAPPPAAPAAPIAGSKSAPTVRKWPRVRLAAVLLDSTRRAAVLETDGHWLQVEIDDQFTLVATDGQSIEVSVSTINRQGVTLHGQGMLHDLVLR